MRDQIDSYISAHKLAWAATTLKNERSRLNAVADVLDANPNTLWEALEARQMKPYSKVTTWVRVGAFWDWLGHTSNPYKVFKDVNARLFKHAYTKKPAGMTMSEARRRINKIDDQSVKRKAFELLHSGLRYSESFQVSDMGVVMGKGGKKRDAFVPSIDGPEFKAGYWNFWKALSDVGLTPHMLRKIRATDLLRKGMDLPTLCDTMGWSSVETALCYTAPMDKEKKSRFFR